MKRILFIATLTAISFAVSCQSSNINIAFIGLWYSISLDNKVDSKKSLDITTVSDKFLVKYTFEKKVYTGNFIFSAEQRGIVGSLNEFGKVVIRKVKSTSGLSMDQLNEVEDIPLGFFQEKSVLEKLLKKKLP